MGSVLSESGFNSLDTVHHWGTFSDVSEEPEDTWGTDTTAVEVLF